MPFFDMMKAMGGAETILGRHFLRNITGD